MKIMSKGFKAAMFALPVLALSGCVSVLPEQPDPPAVYRLTVSKGEAVAKRSNAKILNIDLPVAPRALAGTDIIVSPDGRRLTVTAGSQWAETIPRMLRTAMIDQFSNNPNVIAVDSKGTALANYRVGTHLRRFEAVFDQGEDQAPLCVIQIDANLGRIQTRKLVGSKTILIKKRAPARNVSAIVDTMDRMTHEATQEMEEWINTQLRTQAGQI